MRVGEFNGFAEVIPGRLYQSGQPGTQYGPTWDEIFEADIDAIVNLYVGGPVHVQPGVIYVLWPFPDTAADPKPAMPDEQALAALVNFIEDLIAAGRKVLVHCQAGMNRSAMVAALAYCRIFNCDGAHALDVMRRVRHDDVLFNKAFRAHILKQKASPPVAKTELHAL